jgi:hypothetical protein
MYPDKPVRGARPLRSERDMLLSVGLALCLCIVFSGGAKR